MEYHLLSKSAELIPSAMYLHKTWKISKVVMGQREVCNGGWKKLRGSSRFSSQLLRLLSRMLMLLDFADVRKTPMMRSIPPNPQTNSAQKATQLQVSGNKYR
jgi:hypothetical protein